MIMKSITIGEYELSTDSALHNMFPVVLTVFLKFGTNIPGNSLDKFVGQNNLILYFNPIIGSFSPKLWFLGPLQRRNFEENSLLSPLIRQGIFLWTRKAHL